MRFRIVLARRRGRTGNAVREFQGDGVRNLRFDLKPVGGGAVEGLAPDGETILGAVQFHRDTRAIAGALHASFNDCLDLQLAANIAQVGVVAFKHVGRPGAWSACGGEMGAATSSVNPSLKASS